MRHAIVRAAAGTALRWFYAGIEVEGVERIPQRSPVLLAVNHPNALVDALLVAWTVPRPVVFTAKATLFRNPALAMLLRWAGVVPLIRAKDVREGAGQVDRERNQRAFRALHAALARGRAVLIFPEGISHDEPSLAPLRTGAARIALQARDEAAVRALAIVPVGLTFERKDTPRSKVLVQVGEPIALDDWRAPSGAGAVDALTAEIDARLRAVTLNFATADDAARATALASVFAKLFDTPRPVSSPAALSPQVAITRRIERAYVALAAADGETRDRVDRLLRRLAAFERELAMHHLAIEDLTIATTVKDGVRFALREGSIVALTGPIAVWGQLNHWLPFNVARAIASRSVESAADPAMRTIVAGAALVLLFYGVQGALVHALAGPLVAAAYLVSLPIAADASFYFRWRLRRALRRVRAYFRFRGEPGLQARLLTELSWLREETSALEARLHARPMAEEGAS